MRTEELFHNGGLQQRKSTELEKGEGVGLYIS